MSREVRKLVFPVLLLAALTLAVSLAAACSSGSDNAATPRPSQNAVYQGETVDGRGGHEGCEWDATVEVEEDTILWVLSQPREAPPVYPGDVVRDDMWPPPPEREGDKDDRGVEKRGLNGGRLFYGLIVHWTEDGVLRSGCRYPPTLTPA